MDSDFLNVDSDVLQGSAEIMQGTVDPIDELDNLFKPSTHYLLGGKPDEKAASLKEDDGEVINHDEAHRVFRSPRPSITLHDLQELQKLREPELKEHSGDGASGQITAGGSSMRGGLLSGSPLHDLWLAHTTDLGAHPGLYAGSTVLDAEEAYQAWEEAAREKYEEVLDRWEECVFSDSEAEDITSGDSGCTLR